MKKLFLAFALLGCLVGSARADLRIGFLDPSSPGASGTRNAAALDYARTQGSVVRVKPAGVAGWQTESGSWTAPEVFDVLWYHQGDSAGTPFEEESAADLMFYVMQGGSLLVSGAGGSLLNLMGVESTALRLLDPSETSFASGLLVPEVHRSDPYFEGLDVSEPLLLTSKGGNALADFYDTAGPHGTLVAEGNADMGERPFVSYEVGEGHILFVGWRLPDFTTSGDAYRPNLERFFSNLLKVLAKQNHRHAVLAAPSGACQYARVSGIPFLRASEACDLSASPEGMRTACLLRTEDLAVIEQVPVAGSVKALALTLMDQVNPASAFLSLQEEARAGLAQERELGIQGCQVLVPQIDLLSAPLSALQPVEPDQSVLLGRSPFMAPGDGRGAISPVYEPLPEGGFRIVGSQRKLNRPIVHGQNRVWTGDVPLFRMDTVTGNGSYAQQERVFPLWPRPDAAVGNVNPCMGTLRLGVPDAQGCVKWMDELPDIEARFWPGYTEYRVPGGSWQAEIRVAASLEGHGMICRIRMEPETALVWQFGGMWWQESEANHNKAETHGSWVKITEPCLPNGVVLAGWDGQGEIAILKDRFGDLAAVSSDGPRELYHVAAIWGVTEVDEDRLQRTLSRMDTPWSDPWPEERDRLKSEWMDCYATRALESEARFQALMKNPDKALQSSCEAWDARRAEFQVRTPDPYFDALVNWERCISDYHRQGPGLVLGGQIWQMYSHISTGWTGKEWGGDHQTIEDNLRLYAAFQAEDGFIRWISPSLVPIMAENNTPYWVDQVWQHYRWTKDKAFVLDLWPGIQKAVEWQRQRNDPDQDGLFRDSYEYWNADSNGKGPKAAAASAVSWAMLDSASRLASVVGDSDLEKEYRRLADLTRERILTELWREDQGRLGSIGADRIWRGHPQTWEEYLAINAGLLTPEQGRRAMRWVASHYGFRPGPGVSLLSCSDWFPIRWSCQWVPTGDTALACLAGIRSGDVDLWFPYLWTAVHSSFQSDFPGINMGISNAGAGGGDREDVDSVDPFLQVALKGLFGINPDLHEEALGICPAFPRDWNEASLKTPDLSYEYKKDGDRVTLNIRTSRPLKKKVRADVNAEALITRKERRTRILLDPGPAIPAGPEDERPAPILLEERPRTQTLGVVSGDARQVLFDLSGAYNLPIEILADQKFIFDYADSSQPLYSWWGNPKVKMESSSPVKVLSTGQRFLVSGKTLFDQDPSSVLGLSSWPPYPLPGGANVSVGFPCERVWLLLFSYVHPMKNYVPNGEVVLHYEGGEEKIVSLIPPYNLDCYFQHFSLEGDPIPWGRLIFPAGWSFVHQGLSQAHADVLEIPCEPSRRLDSLSIRATCSEGVLGLLGLTAQRR